MTDWALEADDLYSGVMVVDLAASVYRIALSADFETYVPVFDITQLASLRKLDLAS
jgi:hypothetical protein